METKHDSGALAARIAWTGGWLIFLLILPVMLVCLDIVIQSVRNPERLPAVFGYKALILQPDDQDGGRALGILRSTEPSALREADLVAYRENGVYYIEPVRLVDADGRHLSMQNGSSPEGMNAQSRVAASQIEGRLVQRIPKAGSWALQLQTPTGMLLFLVLPGLLLFLLDAFRRDGPFESDTTQAEARLTPAEGT